MVNFKLKALIKPGREQNKTIAHWLVWWNSSSRSSKLDDWCYGLSKHVQTGAGKVFTAWWVWWRFDTASPYISIYGEQWMPTHISLRPPRRTFQSLYHSSISTYLKPAEPLGGLAARLSRNVSGEGHLKGKIPPLKKRIREFGYRFILILPYKLIAKHSSHL